MGTQELIYTIISAAAVILAALIAGIVTLIVQSKQLKRDGKSIDEAKKRCIRHATEGRQYSLLN